MISFIKIFSHLIKVLNTTTLKSQLLTPNFSIIINKSLRVGDRFLQNIDKGLI